MARPPIADRGVVTVLAVLYAMLLIGGAGALAWPLANNSVATLVTCGASALGAIALGVSVRLLVQRRWSSFLARVPLAMLLVTVGSVAWGAKLIGVAVTVFLQAQFVGILLMVNIVAAARAATAASPSVPAARLRSTAVSRASRHARPC